MVGLLLLSGAGEPPPPVAPGLRLAPASVGASHLTLVPGVGPVLAGRIVARREASGGFASVDDLIAVPGVGERMLDDLDRAAGRRE